ncbi:MULTISPECIES: glycosyltransferase family 4 protein [unclassified Leptolyngbya]|uniref:glycosyltransferase family 4 protein n=1 Tax=unclassified Leptolyngbya TaxID=2650499 RepID=UPI001AC13C83|nr:MULTISPECIES: glycosyltransferase family 4 protein [unclassified Leptolyngbya]MBN8563396.1 glycosyltransferase family 4 protein [Leptolyngbya sp. UWPOB_LEPTO1]MCY6493559.1 glycosyltransferase family 4 protein [Leptolyngbya sp. GGD]
MRVLHINQSDTYGGAAIAGYRLHQGLLSQGVDSRLMVGRMETNDDRVSLVPHGSPFEQQFKRVTQKFGFNHVHLWSTFQIAHHDFYQSAEVLNFHNIHTGFFNYLALPRLVKRKPAVLTLHDMWLFTGHCAYSYGCDRWKIGCGDCPDLTIYPAMRRDSTRWEWKLKDWLYNQAAFSVIAPSRWLADLAHQSLLSRFPIYHIPNGIDLEVYQPLNRADCRSKLQIPPDRQVILFVSHTLKDARKGGDVMLQALGRLPNSAKSNLVLLAMGEEGDNIAAQVGIDTISLGYVKEEHLKAIAYSAADLFVFPTRADNLPLVLQESMACGTPMVSCDVGGVSDLVRPDVTGYLAKPEDVEDLSRGIQMLLNYPEQRRKMGEACRSIAVSEYSINLQVQRYLDVYQQSLSQ